METKEMVNTENKVQEIQLVKGTFTPSEASHVISSLLEEKINFHKIQRLQIWEGDCTRPATKLNNRIEELEKEKEVAKEFIAQMRKEGRNLKINGILEISLED